jgi:hypothetical protein
MKPYIFIITCFFTAFVDSYAQVNFVDPTPDLGSCQRNVNDPVVPGFRDDIKRAALKFHLTLSSGPYDCSGTLINRNTEEDNLGQYFITSWHCFKSGGTCGGNEFDFQNQTVELTFNFQSPPDHLGKVFQDNQTGTICRITRNIRLVDHVDCGYGDVAICEILGDPIPPHFNPYFAGWIPIAPSPVSDFINIGHGDGSIKQAAGTYAIEDGLTGNSLNRTCKTVTKVVDFLLGWIWKHKTSTQVICQYVQVPFVDTRYVVYGWNYGTVADGQSGSGIFGGTNRLFGNLSGGPAIYCTTDIVFFGKLPSYYYRQAIKNALNPPNKWSIDEFGIDGRNRGCYESINYNYPANNYTTSTTPLYLIYPAKYYQAQNDIVLNSKTFVNLGSNSSVPVVIKTESDFTFNAGTSIDLTYCDVETGAIFTANPGVSCNYSSGYRLAATEESSNYEANAKNELYARIRKVKIPSHMDLNESFTKKKMIVSIHPNPASDELKVDLISLSKGNVDVIIYDVMGRQVMKQGFYFNGQKETSIFVESLINGIYQVMFVSGENRVVEKLVVQK